MIIIYNFQYDDEEMLVLMELIAIELEVNRHFIKNEINEYFDSKEKTYSFCTGEANFLINLTYSACLFKSSPQHRPYSALIRHNIIYIIL